MSADLPTLLEAFDRGRLSRRQLLMALGIGVAVRPAAAFAQGQCGGARANLPECDRTPAKPPFEPTGWKTVLLGGIIIRRGGGGNRGASAGTPPARRAGMGHIAFGITPFDADQVAAELQKRGLNARVDTGGRGDIHTAQYKSYHTTTPNGYDLQISDRTRVNRNA